MQILGVIIDICWAVHVYTFAAVSRNKQANFPNKLHTSNKIRTAQNLSFIMDFWLSEGRPISPDVRPRRRRAKILSQF